MIYAFIKNKKRLDKNKFKVKNHIKNNANLRTISK